MTTPSREFRPLPNRPVGDDLTDLSWAAEAYEAANHNIKVAIARALENPARTTSQVHERAPFSAATVNKIARDMEVPKRKPGGHK